MGEPSERLKKKGIQTVTDNLQPGDQVSFGKAFNRIFRAGLEQRIFTLPPINTPKPKKRKRKTA